MRTILAILTVLLSAALGGCGGGGDSGPAPCRGTMANPDLCLGDATATPTGTAAVGLASLKLSLTDSSGAASSQVSPDHAGVLQALVKDGKGIVVPNVAVTFTTSDKTGIFVPSSGTALTDANGVAQVSLPASTQAGAFTVTANGMVSGTAVVGTTSYAVTFPTLTFSPLAIAPASLSAGGTASLGVTVLNGAMPFTPAQSVSFTSPCAAAGKATISSPVVTVNGVASTSYTDKGCGGADIITAATSLAGATFTQTGTVTVLTATAGQIGFVSALPQNIALKGTGGAGRQESSTVTFKVLDINSNPVSGKVVNFDLTTYVGGLTRNPISSTTGADGTVSTVVAAGTVNTPVRVTATLAGTAITTLSDQLVVSTGVPDQNSFSLSTEIYNVEGMNHDGCEAPVGSRVRISLADHFNNPAPDGTAVSFTAEGGTVDASCLTGLVNTTLTDGTVITQKGIPGQCSVRFCAANPRPVDGRITILAYALGEESFIDNPTIVDGINRYDVSEQYQDLREPFRYDRAITSGQADDVNNGNNIAAEPASGEPFIDSTGLGFWDRTGDGFYNGVLQSAPNGKTPAIHVRESFVLVLSGSDAAITPLSPDPLPLDQCVNGIPFANTPQPFSVAIRDKNPTIFPGNILPGNILPAGTKIEFTANGAVIAGTNSFTVPNTDEPSSAVWTYSVLVQSDAVKNSSDVCVNPFTSGVLTVKVTTPLGVITTKSYSVTD